MVYPLSLEVWLIPFLPYTPGGTQENTYKQMVLNQKIRKSKPLYQNQSEASARDIRSRAQNLVDEALLEAKIKEEWGLILNLFR